jgi:hypothetical protein
LGTSAKSLFGNKAVAVVKTDNPPINCRRENWSWKFLFIIRIQLIRLITDNYSVMVIRDKNRKKDRMINSRIIRNRKHYGITFIQVELKIFIMLR